MKISVYMEKRTQLIKPVRRILDDGKKLFKRTKIEDTKEIWILESTVDMNHLIDENRDFCEYQQKKITELDSHLLTSNACSFNNEMENMMVVTSELDTLITEKYDLENRIKELDQNITQLDLEKERKRKEKELTLNKLKQI